MNPRTVVYFDEDYPSSFIGYDEGRRISNFLVVRGFARVDAIQLKDWMNQAISENLAGGTSCVFAMDILPEQIFGDVDGNVSFRRYLDAGGRITWLGDIPAWYKGRAGKQREEVWSLGSFVSLLGIAPAMANCVMPVELSSRGRTLGLSTPWYSMRPILANKDWMCEYTAESPLSPLPLEVLAWTNVTLGNSVVKIPGRLSSVRSLSFGLQVGVSGGVTINRGEGIRMYKKTCASAWRIVFNSRYPNQGFFRIWDHPARLADLSDDRL